MTSWKALPLLHFSIGGLSANQNVGSKEPKQVHQPKGKGDEHYEFLEIRYKTITVELCKDTTAGMNVDHDEVFYMTVFVKMFNGRTISIKRCRKQEAKQINEEVGRKTQIPKEQQYLAFQGKFLKDGKTIGDCNVQEYTTIEMILRMQGGTKNEESMTSAGIAGHRQVKRKSSDPCSEISGFDKVQPSDVTAHEELREGQTQRNDETNGKSHEANG